LRSYDEWSENQFVSGLSFNVENIFSGVISTLWFMQLLGESSLI